MCESKARHLQWEGAIQVAALARWSPGSVGGDERGDTTIAICRFAAELGAGHDTAGARVALLAATL
jgi:hypothetical protein